MDIEKLILMYNQILEKEVEANPFHEQKFLNHINNKTNRKETYFEKSIRIPAVIFSFIIVVFTFASIQIVGELEKMNNRPYYDSANVITKSFQTEISFSISDSLKEILK